MDRNKDVLTTGQVARLCRVAPRTVSKWFDTGQLRGYRIPGSKDRRIPRAQLIRFMRAHGMPLDGLESDHKRVLIIDADNEWAGLLQRTLGEHDYEVRLAESVFEAGATTAEFHPDVLLVDVDLPGIDGHSLARFFAARPEVHGAQLLAMGASITESDIHILLQEGFHRALRKPFHLRELTDLIEEGVHAMA